MTQRTLTQSSLQHASELLKSGNLDRFYSFFSNAGYGYASLARQVVDGSTVNGVIANNFLFTRA